MRMSFAGLRAAPPYSFSRRLQVGGDTLEPAGKIFVHAVELFPGKGIAIVVGAGQQDLHEVHLDNSIGGVNATPSASVRQLSAHLQ